MISPKGKGIKLKNSEIALKQVLDDNFATKINGSIKGKTKILAVITTILNIRD